MIKILKLFSRKEIEMVHNVNFGLNPLKTRKSFRLEGMFGTCEHISGLNPLKTRKSFRQYHLQTLIIQGITRPFFRMSQKFSKILAFFMIQIFHFPPKPL